MRHPGRCCLAQRRLHMSLPASVCSSHALPLWNMGWHGWEQRGKSGVGSSKCRGWFGTEAKPFRLCCSLPPALIQRFLWKHRCSAPHAQVAMALLISICRERCGAGAWTGDRETARVSDGREGQSEGKWEGTRRSAMTSQSHTAVWGGSQASACSLRPLTCLLDCAT